MNLNLRYLIDTMHKDHGKTVNLLIDNDIISYESVIEETLKLGVPSMIFDVANYIKYTPIDKLADAIININDPEFIYKFASDVKDAPKDDLVNAIIGSNDSEYINLARNLLPRKEKKEIDKLCKYIKNDRFHDIRYKSDEYKELLKDGPKLTKKLKRVGGKNE